MQVAASYLVAACLFCSGCQQPQSTLYPQGPAANKIAHLSWLMLILFLVITAIMWILITWAIRAIGVARSPSMRPLMSAAGKDGSHGAAWHFRWSSYACCLFLVSN